MDVAISIFVSYAPQDDTLLQELEKHLRPLQRQGIITTWHRRKLLAGMDWQHVLDDHLDKALVILLLISVDFLDSEYCYGVEMQRALTRHASGDVIVIPVLLRSAYLQGSPLAHLQCVPRNGQPVTLWKDRDEAFREIVAEIHTAIQNLSAPRKKHLGNKEQKLRAMLANHRSFLQDRLESFVGRALELEELKQHIKEKLNTGGYITITGQAGQGKSSIIAKLVQEYGLETVAFHFIPFNPGPDHQVGLLRNIMARLILKYDLSDLYVAGESRAVLRDFLPRVLEDVIVKGGREVIFIDGLDQLQEDYDGMRDLSFLPNNPPGGIVFVLGTRPNDTLRPLELLKPRNEYQLPNLHREDFDLILSHRRVLLEKELADRFYYAMQENALYLDLVAKELREQGAISPQDMIARIADNPENLFSLSIARLKRHPKEWHDVIKPILGLLLTTREPLFIGHIRQILQIDHDRVKDGITRLGGLLTESEQRCYSLFHLKLHDYLRQDNQRPSKDYIFSYDEEKQFNSILSSWCESPNIDLIWKDTKDLNEQKRRKYAKQYYITHLYLAMHWDRLFMVLDECHYGQAKVHYDPSMRSYALDLDLGRQAAAWEGRTMEECLEYLPQLWRYTLLRCSLASMADSYPESAFQLLLLLGRESEALGLAELLTEPHRKARMLLLITKYMITQPNRELETLQMFMRIREVSLSIENSQENVKALQELGKTLIQAKQWERAEGIWQEIEKTIHPIKNSQEKAKALQELGKTLIQAKQWERLKYIFRYIEDNTAKEEFYQELARSFIQAQRWDKAREMWQEAKRISQIIKNSQENSKKEVVSTRTFLIITQQWEKATHAVQSIKNYDERAAALEELGRALIQAQQWERAERAVCSIKDISRKMRILKQLGLVLIQAQQWEQAERVIYSIEDSSAKALALVKLGRALAVIQQWERAEKIWQEAEDMTQRAIGNVTTRAQIYAELGKEFALAQQWVRAKKMWQEAERVIHVIGDSGTRVPILASLARALIQIQQWEQAERVIRSITDSSTRLSTLAELGRALIQTQQWEQAERVIRSAADSGAKVELGRALIQTQQWEQAERVTRSIADTTWRLVALRELGQALIQSQQWERNERIWQEIKEITYSIENIDTKVDALVALGQVLIEVQQWEQAERIWQEIEETIRAFEIENDGKAKEEVTASTIATNRTKLGRALIQTQQWQRVERVIHSIGNINSRMEALVTLGKALIQTQQWERAERVIHSIGNTNLRTEALVTLGKALIQTQQHEQAERIWQETETIIYSIENIDTRMEALVTLGKALIQTQQREQAERIWQETEKTIHASEGWSVKASILAELGRILIQTQQWQRAERVIYSMRDSFWRPMTLRELVRALTQARQWNHAIEVAQSIDISSWRAEALIELGKSATQAQQWQQVDKVWNESEGDNLVVGNSRERFKLLIELGKSAIQAQQWQQVDKVWNEVEKELRKTFDSHEKLKFLSEVVEALGSVHEYERFLHIVQQSWLQVNKRAYALQLLPLATGLIPLKPKLGIAFFEAFEWVDAFLQG